LIDSFPQFGESQNGIPDLAWDGELLWGVDDRYFYGISPEGESIRRFRGHFSPTTTVAWDPDRELLWSSGLATDFAGTNRAGEDIEEISNPGFRIYGLAYWPEDPDSYQLYILNKSPDDRQLVHKMNLNTGDTLFVRELLPERGGLPRGAFIKNEVDEFGGWVFMNISDSEDGDRVDIWQLSGNWMIVEPLEGTLNPDEEQELVLTLDASGLWPIVYEDELIFNMDNVGSETRIPVTLTVTEPNEIKQEDAEISDNFKLLSVYPNPFNSMAVVRCNLPAPSDVVLRVFDLSGREVMTIQQEQLSVGTHSIILEGSNLVSGLYLVRLTASGQVINRKVVFFK